MPKILEHEGGAKLYHDITDSNGDVTRYYDLSEHDPAIDYHNKWIIAKAS